MTLTAFPDITQAWQQIVVFVSIASMALGSFAAIGQTNIKRLMAYSSIGHMGFALVGLAAGTPEGAQGVLVYIAIYVMMTLGTFSIILAMKRDGQALENISDFAGLARTNPLLAFFMAMLLFSLAGVPPLAGFFAKFYVFMAAINAGLFTLAVLGVLASVVGAYYYLTIVKVMYFDEPAGVVQPMRAELRTVLAVAGLFNILFAFYPSPLVSAAVGRREVAVLMAFALGSQAQSAGYRLVSFDSIGSTNAEGLARRKGRRAGAAVARHRPPDQRPRTAQPRLDFPARQPCGQRARGRRRRAAVWPRRSASPPASRSPGPCARSSSGRAEMAERRVAARRKTLRYRSGSREHRRRAGWLS